ncbi:MAG: hypothetical protein KGM15_08745 [Pseudomonadota bacterium]|nr:hypothetical protein [Pseudomonadota bacterium]
MSDDSEETARWRQTLVGLVVVVLLLVAGWWVMSDLQHHREIDNCIASGRRDCVPLETGK